MTRPSTYLPDALTALRRREEQYPGLVAAGKLPQDSADGEIVLWQGIARDCRFNGADAADVAAKVEALEASIRRFDRALSKEIGSLPEKVRLDCFEGIGLWHLELLHGAAVRVVLEIHEQRDRMAMLRDWYRARRNP